jgi:hypothetical protein
MRTTSCVVVSIEYVSSNTESSLVATVCFDIENHVHWCELPTFGMMKSRHGGIVIVENS